MKIKITSFLMFLTPLFMLSQISIDNLLDEKFDNGIEQCRTTIFIEPRDFTDELKREFQSIVDNEFAKSGAAGISCAVISGDDQWTGVAGLSSPTDSMTSEMVLGIGSLTKSISSAVILKLEEEGKLSIDDLVEKWIGKRKYVDSTITIRQLLNHTSGVYNMTDNPKFVQQIQSGTDRIWTPEEVLDSFLLEPYFAPGDSWHYSNSGYIMIGMIIEKVSGKKYHEVVREKLLKPYGLDSMYLKPYETNSLEVGHFWASPTGGDQGIDLTGLGFDLKALFSGAWAAGAYMARTIDITKWMRLLASGKVLTAESQKELVDGVSLSDNVYYGLGVGYLLNPDSSIFTIGHDGNIGYTTKVFHFLKEKLTVGIQCNDATVSENTLNNILKRIYLAYITKIDLIENTIIDYRFKVFPNPAKNTVNIDFTNIKLNEIIIYNNFGKKMDKISLVNKRKINIDISGYPKGMYYVKGRDVIGRFTVL